MIHKTSIQHNDIKYNMLGNIDKFYSNTPETRLMQLYYNWRSIIHLSPSYVNNMKFLTLCRDFSEIYKLYMTIDCKLQIRQYINFTRMNFTPSDKFLCDCCAIYDGTTVFQLDILKYILRHVSNDHVDVLNRWSYTCTHNISELIHIKYSAVWLYKDTVVDDINNLYNKYINIIHKRNLSVNETFLYSLRELIKFKEYFGCIEKRHCPYKFLTRVSKGIRKEHVYLNFEDNYAPHIKAVCEILSRKGTVSCGECSLYLEKEYFKNKRLIPQKYIVSDVFCDYVKLIYACYET